MKTPFTRGYGVHEMLFEKAMDILEQQVAETGRTNYAAAAHELNVSDETVRQWRLRYMAQ